MPELVNAHKRAVAYAHERKLRMCERHKLPAAANLVSTPEFYPVRNLRKGSDLDFLFHIYRFINIDIHGAEDKGGIAAAKLIFGEPVVYGELFV